MRIPPVDVYLTWPTPNYTNPPTRGPALIIINIIFIIIVLVAVVGRFYARIYIRKWLGLDDYMCVPALFFTIATFIAVILANEEYGWKRHVWDIPFDMIPSANIVAFVAKLTFTFAATFIRISLICFYYRLVKDSGIRWFNWVLHASVAWTLAVCLVFVILTIWLCSPVRSYWVFPPLPGSRCLDEGKVMLGGGVVNSVSDLLTTVLPIPIVMRLQMPLKQRIGVCVLLCLGMIVTIAGSLRTYFTWKSLMESWDETWFAYPLWIAAAVEIDLGLICCCAPAWKTLLQEPIRELTCKLSSLRSPSNTPNSSAAAKPSIFDPLRSLPWFQHNRFEFEGTRRDDEEFGLKDLVELSAEGRSTVDLSAGAPSPTSESEEKQQAAGAQSPGLGFSRPTARLVLPELQIEVQQSFEQRSLRLSDSPVMPADWMADGQSARSSIQS